MPTFRYSGYGAGGKSVTGTVEADSLREATQRLKRDGLFPKEVAPLDETLTGKGRLFRRGVSLPDLALMTRRLATLVASSVPLFEGVTTLWEQEEPGAEGDVDWGGLVGRGCWPSRYRNHFRTGRIPICRWRAAAGADLRMTRIPPIPPTPLFFHELPGR